MPQRLKPEVRQRILLAAADTFAEQGYCHATLAGIASRASVTTSNIYKYFGSKDSLFAAIVTPTQAARFLRLLRWRMREFSLIDRWSTADAEGSRRARALLAYWIEQRQVVLILLRGAQGTRYENLRELSVREMKRHAENHLRKVLGSAPPEHLSFVLHQVFSHTVDMITAILSRYESSMEIEQAIGCFWRYQLAGLQALLGLESSATA